MAEAARGGAGDDDGTAVGKGAGAGAGGSSVRTGADAPAARVLSRLVPFIAPYRGRVALAAGSLLVAAAATLAIPVAFRFLIDRGFAAPAAADEPSGPSGAAEAVAEGGGRTETGAGATGSAIELAGDVARRLGGAEAGDVNAVFLALFGVALVLAAATAVRYYCVSWLGERIVADLRSAVFAKVLRQDPAFFETLRSGEVLSRLTSDTTLIQSLVGSSISLGLRNAILFAGALGLMVWSSPGLAAIIVALLAFTVVPILVVGRKVRRLSRASQDRLADTSARAGETLGAMSTVQSYVRESMEAERYADAVDEAFRSAVRRNSSRAALTAIAITLVFGAIVFVLWLGAQAVMSGRMSPGMLTQFMLYAALVAGSTGALSEVLGDVQRAAGATERLLELLDAEPSILPGARTRAGAARFGPPGPASPDDATGRTRANAADGALPAPFGARVDFDAVSFSYPSRPAERALAELSFAVLPGETVALVGPSGAGKTTVLQLLLRFYDPDAGAVRLDGVPLGELSLESLRGAIGLVSQESVVFSDDVAANLRYGRPDASDEELVAAARAAEAHEFIERLPDGYATYLGERGVRLSGGQRQRLSIARALLKNPPLLLLDEATSALDAESERKVQAALERAMSGRTTLVIAHRLATVVDADRILVMEEGRLVDSGTHAELVARGGTYARLASLQFEVGEAA